MTDEEIRRIRRLVVGELPPAAHAPRAVDPRHEERFRRALSMPRRAAESVSERASDAAVAGPRGGAGAEAAEMAAGASAAAEAPAAVGASAQPIPRNVRPGTAARGSTRLQMDRTGDGFAESHNGPVARSRQVSARPVSAIARRSTAGVQPLDEDGADAEPLDLAPPTAASTDTSSAVAPTPRWLLDAPVMPLPTSPPSAALPDAWAQGLADTVVTLCSSSDPNFHSWTIQVPIDSAALPHTELRMTFSRHHLLLRFSTQSTQSYALISAHQSQLQRLLRSDLPGDRHIDIELT
ncbi:type III secretion HpaP family protein [Roseateles terrae]|uniref:Flagellar hook-length control protein-like C-terminal domain-containing protein n=1 Tax=Roseateles terrae TaxID=431060 RepID=A0ABR6GNH9_9BURK|nr:type III secretion HpaP family protein [Roseateles terrae]MBB3193671.1 hypothetical protein [Roseateles terrae]